MTTLDEMIANALQGRSAFSAPTSLDIDGYSLAASAGTDRGLISAQESEFDLRTMTPFQLQAKYGVDGVTRLYQQQQSGVQQFMGDRAVRANRHGGEVLWDSTTGIGSGFVGGIGGLASLATGLVNENAGTWLADKVQSGTSWVEENQSDAVNAARRLQRAESSVDARDNTARMNQEIAEGDSELVAGMRRWGRDFVDTMGNSITDPTMLTQGTSEAVGSLLAGGPISKGLKAIGAPIMAAARGSGVLARTAATGADDSAAILSSLRQGDSLIGAVGTGRIARAGEFAAWPAAIAGLEAGGAYSGTVSEIMSMEHDQLMQTSPSYREMIEANVPQEEARTRIANRAGMMAAAIQAPIAGAAGLLTRFAETPFRVPSFGSAARNVAINEPLEEAVQSTTGGLAQGLAVQQYADENRDLTEGLGEQTAQGALYGFTAAGTVQGPGMAVRAPLAALGVTKKFLADRYNSAIERAENASPVGDSKIKEAATEIRNNIAPIAQSLQQVVETSEATPEQKAKEIAYISTLSNALSLAPEEIAAIPEAVRTNVDTSGRVEAIRSLGKHMRALEKGTDAHFAAMAAYLNLLEPIRTIQQVETPLLDQIKEDSPEYATFQNIRQLLSLADKSINARKVVEDAGLLLSSEKVTNIIKQFASVESAKTPEGQQAVQQVAALTSLDPTAGTKETNNFLLKHHEGGNIQLTAPQLAAVQASNALIDAHEAFTKEQKAKGLIKAKNFVDEQIVSNSDPLVKKGKYKLSGRQYVNEILQNLMTGNLGYAAEMLEDLGLFAQHMQYKVDALNKHYAAGSAKGNHGLDKIGYTALSPKNFESDARPWYQVPANKGLHVAANNAESVRSAQTFNLEAQTINTLYNNLRAALPELTTVDGQPLPEMTFAPLDPAIADGTVQEVVQRHTTKQPAKPQPAKAQEAAPAKQETTPAPEVEKSEVTEIIATGTASSITSWTSGGSLGLEAIYADPSNKERLLSIEISPSGVQLSISNPRDSQGEFAGSTPLNRNQLEAAVEKIVGKGTLSYLNNLIERGNAAEKAGKQLGDGFNLMEAELLKFEKNPVKNGEVTTPTTEESKAQTKLTIEERRERNRVRNEEVTNKQWMKGDRQELRPTDGRARIKVQDTTISYDRTGDQITLNLIHTPQEARGKGSAQAAMRKFLELTDAAGVTVSLVVAEQDNQTTFDGLMNFYSSFGFVQIEGHRATRKAAEPTDPNKPFELNPGQKAALSAIEDFLDSKDNTFSLIGSAGTGKTTIVDRIIAGIKPGKFSEIVLTSPTHRANGVTMSKNPDKTVSTLHRLLKLRPEVNLDEFDATSVEFNTDAEIDPDDLGIPNGSLLLVDESSMINDALYDYLMEQASMAGAKVIFIGDNAQLRPVKAENRSKALRSSQRSAELTQVMRAKNAQLLDESIHVRETGSFTNNIHIKDGNGVTFTNTRQKFLSKFISMMKSPEFQKNRLLARIVAFSDSVQNPVVSTYNRDVFQALFPGEKNFPVGSLIMGYNAFGDAPKGDTRDLPKITNGLDYIVQKVGPQRTVNLLGARLVVQSLVLEDTLGLLNHRNEAQRTVDVILHDETPREELDAFGKELSDLHYRGYNRGDNYSKELYDRTRDSIAVSQDLVITITPKNGKAPFKKRVLKKTFDYGYAHTIHKSQGGTYTNVFVDDANINLARDSQFKSELRYVGITRAERAAIILTKGQLTQTEVASESTQDSTQENSEVKLQRKPVKQIGVEPNVLDEVTPSSEIPEAVEPTDEAVAATASVKTTPEPEVVDVPLPPTFGKMQERFSTLWNATRNYILTKFRPAVGKDGQPVSRLEGVRNPVSWVTVALSDKETLTEVLGKEPKRELTPEITSAYEGILDQTGKYQFTVGGLLRKLNDNLQEFVKTRKKWLAGGDAQQAISAKQLNLLEESIDEKGNVTYSYNPELIQSAALAAIQWLLSNNNTNRKLDREEYERIAGYESFTEEVIRFIDGGLPKTQIIPALSNMIRQFWGIQPLADADIAHSNAVVDAVAAELLNAMSELEFVEKKQLKLGEKQNYQGEGRTLENFSIKLHKHSEKTLGYSVEALKQFTDLIQTVALTNPEPTRYIDGDIPPVADTQMNNPSVRNTPAQRRAIERAQEASASRLDLSMWHITNALGRDGLTDFLSDMDPSWTEENTNKVHWDTLQAQRLGIQNAFDEVQTTVGEMKNTTSGKSLKDIVVRYAFNFSKVGRLQMLGSYTAQASKFTREVLLPTWSKLNLFDNADHQQAFALAQMQHLDIKLDKKKVHQVDPSLVPAFIEATYADEKVQPLLKAVRDWMKTADLTSEDPSPKSLDGFEMRALMKDAGFAVSTGALHSVVEWVRYKDANEAGQKDFETSLYLEADGVTNGPIMAMLMLTVGKFDKSWMDAVQKGGIYFGASKPFHQLYALNNVDLYKQAAQNMESSYKLRRAAFDKQPDSKKLNALATDMNTVMGVLFGKDFTYNPVDRTVTFDRGFTKNPLTITLYGSGARGIAGNFVDALLEKLYEMSTQRVNSDIPISPEFEDALDRILTTNIWYDQESKTYSVRGKAKQVDFWNKEYSATKQQMDALRNNFLYAIVEPMREAISATVGSGVVNGMASVQQATQVQSVFVQEMYRNEVEALLEKKKSQPGYRKGDFLSPKELREIDAKVVRAFPNITTRGQIFRVAKNAPLPLSGHGDYARALNDTLYVEPDIKAPAEAGVAGVASVNIGFGDGNMIQITISDPSMGRSLPVFDGWNMPLDAIAHQSEQLNKAVAEAAMGNPLAAIYRSFQKVLENASDVELSKSALASLARTFEADDLTQDAAIALVETLGARLAQEVKEIDARHKAMKFVGFSVDHMASAGAPHYEGAPNDLTPDQNLELLQAKYEEYLAEPEETANSVAKDAPAAQVYTWDTLKYLVGELKMSGAQKLMYEQVLSAMGAANYTIIAGTREQIHQYMKDNGEDTANFDEKTNGLIHNGKIYLANPTGETLTHELIHAATMNAVIAYYNGQDLGPAGALIQEAIQNLEPMAEDFMNMQVDPNWSLSVLQAFLNARNSMAQQRANGSQAGFIGEFIAWTTTNTALTKTLKTVQPSRVTHWTRSVLGLIKRVLFGKRKMPEVAEDFLSNVQFNASILVQAQITLPEVYEQLTLKHATADSKLERVRDGFQNWVVRNLKPNPMHRAQVRDVQQSVAAEELANYAGDIFGLGQLEKDTLREVMAALATEASIDPQAMIGIQEMYRLAQEKLDPSDFVDENSLNLDADTTKAQWKFQLLMGKRDRFYDTSKRSDLLPLFLGLALVSPEVQGVLAKIKIPGKKKGAKTLDEGLENLASNMMQSLSGRLTSRGNSQNVQQALDNMTENLLRNIAKTKTNMDVVEARTDQALRANEFVKNQLQNLSAAGVKYGKKLETLQNKLTRTTGKLIRFSAAMASETEADKAADGLLQFASAIEVNNTMMSLAKDLVGRTAAIGDVYDRIKATRAMTQQMRQNFRDRVPEVILKKFKTKPTDKQMATMFKGFAMTDIVALSENTQDLNDLLTDPAKVKARIKSLQDSIKKKDPKHWAKLDDKMKELAHFMMTKKRVTLRNAYAIANLWTVPGTGNRPQPSEAMIAEIDQLTSLYALELLSQEERDTLASLVQNEEEGVNFILSYLVGQRKTEMARTKLGNARGNYYKGFVPSLPTNGGQIIVADDANFVDLKHQGFTRIGTYNGHGTTSRGYYYTSTPTQASFAQGMMQNINQTAGGVERSTGFSTSPVANRITNRRMVRSLIGKMQAETRMTENLSPIFNDRGVIIAFEQLMDPTMLEMVKPSTELHKMLGVWRGRQVEELQATKVNMALLDTLKTNYDEADDKGLYVNILDRKNLDRVEADAVRLFSEETLEYAKEVFGENRIMVRRDLIDDVIGYRNFSVSDFWTDNNRLNTDTNKAIRQTMISFIGSDAYKVLVKSEQFVQGLVSDARTQIVVKSVIVPAINIAGNMLHLMQRGVNPIMIAREFPKKLNELNTYLRTYLEQVELEAELRAATKPTHITQIQAKIRSIKDAHRRLTIWPLIEAGEFSSIADIGNSREDLQLTSGRLNEWVGQQIDKLPQEARTLAKYGLVTKDTALFQGLQKSVQYGDFLAKAILYDHMLIKENRTREQALARLTEEFINYDRLPGRVRGGLENLGLLWFYNFKLRSLKVGLSILRNNPLHAAMSMVIPTPFGIDTALDANIAVKAMEGALPYSLGPGMGLRAITLNPWINLVN